MEINFDNFPVIVLVLLGLFEIALGLFFRKKYPMKIVIPILVTVFFVVAVLMLPTVNYQVSKNPKIPKNIKLK